MSESSLYERYKDALRRGHVAAMRGRTEVALAAYVEAATIAPDRALPHASIGSVYLRAGRPGDALAAFDAALTRSAGDEASLAGRATSLEGLGRRADAAAALDELAAVQDAAGRTADACDTAARALGLAESRPRRRAVEALVARLRESDPDEAALASLERAVHLLEATDRTGGGRAPDGAPTEGAVSAAVGPPPPVIPPLAESLELADRAAIAASEGRADEARRSFLEVAAQHAAAGRQDAALDACASVVMLAPADPGVHLALAALYLDRGWRPLAAEKLELLGRLADLTGDAETRAAIAERTGGAGGSAIDGSAAG